MWRTIIKLIRSIVAREKFGNVPAWLTEKVKAIANDGGPQDRPRIYYAAAGWTIAWYLRVDIQAANADIFFEPPNKPPIDDNDTLWHDHVNRSISIAETLFIMRSMSGFEELRGRLEKKQPKRAAYFELLAAKQFFKHGFEIIARSEKNGRRGENFDFAARKRNQTINVEVTALTVENFNKKTISNSLQNKRTQVPDDAPAILYCVLPEVWTADPIIDWDDVLNDVTKQFFRRSKRWNAVVFWIEQHLILKEGPGAAMFLVRRPYTNQDARHQTELDFLFKGERSVIARNAIATGERLEELRNSSYQSEFFEWVDFLVPEPSSRA